MSLYIYIICGNPSPPLKASMRTMYRCSWWMGLLAQDQTKYLLFVGDWKQHTSLQLHHGKHGSGACRNWCGWWEERTSSKLSAGSSGCRRSTSGRTNTCGESPFFWGRWRWGQGAGLCDPGDHFLTRRILRRSSSEQPEAGKEEGGRELGTSKGNAWGSNHGRTPTTWSTTEGYTTSSWSTTGKHTTSIWSTTVERTTTWSTTCPTTTWSTTVERTTTRSTIHNTRYTNHNTEYAIHNTQYTIHITQHTMHNTRYTIQNT